MQTTHPSFPEMFIMNVPCLSTRHITKEDGARLLDPGCVEVLAEITGGFGHILHFEAAEIDEEFSLYSPALRAVLHQLAAAGFEYVRFDSDSAICPKLPTFDW